MSILLEDLLHEVLSFLPSKDLLRLRCVSKSWRALIDSPYFIQLHLNKSLKDIKSPKVVVTSFFDDDDGLKHIFYAISFDSEFKFSVPKEIKPPKEIGIPIPNLSSLHYMGCFRSLICLQYFTRLDNGYEHKIAVWNPFTRSHRTLPSAPTDIEGRRYNFRYAFGYDEVADDYKVVRLAFRGIEYELYEARVYSLKLDTWKQNVKVPIHFRKYMSKPIHANGTIFWLSRGRDETEFSLLILPLRTQVLQLVSFPLGDSEFNDSFSRLFWEASSCGFGYCDCIARDLLKLINSIKNDALTNLLLPQSNINEAMGYLEHSFHEKLCLELQSFCRNLHEKSTFIYSDSVDSLLRVERSNNKSKLVN